MDSARLSARRKQPGHDRTFTTSEENFVEALRRILPAERYDVIDHPRELLGMFGLGAGRTLGIRPEASIRNRETARVMYFEVKKQGDAGNAEERAFKHHTVQFYKTLQALTRMPYHAYCTIFCESLATNPRYTTKFKSLIEPGHYFLWVDYEIEPLRRFILDGICARFLEGPVGAQEIPK
jgi:hypothetical protein